MAQLGRDGWELVAVDADGFYFKRPVPRRTAPALRTAVLEAATEPAPRRAQIPVGTRGRRH